MASEDDIARVFAEVDSQLGRLTHLVNNAGITGRASRLDDAPTGEIRRTIDLNVTGAILVAREAIRRMSPRHGGNGGAIVNLSSAAVWLGAPNDFVWYAASKAAIDALTIGLSQGARPGGHPRQCGCAGVDRDGHSRDRRPRRQNCRTRPADPAAAGRFGG